MKKIRHLIIAIVLILVIAAGSFYTGYHIANTTRQQELAETFYAHITDMNDAVISVEGIPENDSNYRGAFTFQIDQETTLIWRGTAMLLSEFQIGDLISISFTGEIQESYPARIGNVVKVQLLEDEK